MLALSVATVEMRSDSELFIRSGFWHVQLVIFAIVQHDAGPFQTSPLCVFPRYDFIANSFPCNPQM